MAPGGAGGGGGRVGQEIGRGGFDMRSGVDAHFETTAAQQPQITGKGQQGNNNMERRRCIDQHNRDLNPQRASRQRGKVEEGTSEDNGNEDNDKAFSSPVEPAQNTMESTTGLQQRAGGGGGGGGGGLGFMRARPDLWHDPVQTAA